MLQAYVGVASSHGLAVIQPVRDDTLSLVRRCVQAGSQQVAFWVVLGDSEARIVRTLFLGGLRREALAFLDRSAKDIGRILPSDTKSSHLQ